MKRSFWEAAAPKWDAEIFDSLAEDRNGVISGAIGQLGSAAATVADYGCGVGGYLPCLSRAFGRVIALDWAVACVERARARAAPFANVEVARSTPKTMAGLSESCDVALAANVVIDPRAPARERALAQAISLIRPGGWLVIVVPSLESVAYSYLVRRMLRPATRSLYGSRAAACCNCGPGIVTIDGQPTKHFAGEELLFLLRTYRCLPGGLQRVEYAWNTQRLPSAHRIREPGPWDWLVVAQKAGRDGPPARS